MSASPGWLSRYRNGQRSHVWQELRQLGRAVHERGLAAEAQLVCDEMARRARRNVEIVVDRLTEQGYRFHSNDDEQAPVTPYHLPDPGAEDLADWLLEQFGAVPMTLLSWVRLVGDVWLVGTHPQWPESASADPLVIEAEGARYPGESIREYFEETFDAWREESTADPDAGAFVLPLCSGQTAKRERQRRRALWNGSPRRLCRWPVRRGRHHAICVLCVRQRDPDARVVVAGAGSINLWDSNAQHGIPSKGVMQPTD